MTINAKKTHGGAGRNQGRKPDGETTLDASIPIRMTSDQKAKLGRLGGSPWVRKKIDQAKEPE